MKKKKILDTEINVPHTGDPYWYVGVSPAYGIFIVISTTWRDFGSDKRRLVSGNIYYSEAEAKDVADKFNLMLEEL